MDKISIRLASDYNRFPQFELRNTFYCQFKEEKLCYPDMEYKGSRRATWMVWKLYRIHSFRREGIFRNSLLNYRNIDENEQASSKRWCMRFAYWASSHRSENIREWWGRSRGTRSPRQYIEFLKRHAEEPLLSLSQRLGIKRAHWGELATRLIMISCEYCFPKSRGTIPWFWADYSSLVIIVTRIAANFERLQLQRTEIFTSVQRKKRRFGNYCAIHTRRTF